ncbi:hypothetical protein [Nostoc sp. C110]|uniref:hypothetical protein n=1 Tax=Nostoc sp. C110 TaxID=3349876 RepID=UPI00370D0533
MISDVLFDAKNDIEYYLTELTFSDVYSDAKLREQLHELMISMEKIRVHLDTEPNIEQNFESLKIKIEERCRIANIEYRKIIFDNDNSEGLEIFLQEGRSKRSVIISISNARKAGILLEHKFENYKFLSGYNGICSYEEKYIEVLINSLDKSSIQKIYDRLFNLDNSRNYLNNISYENDTKLELTYNSSEGLNITILISPISDIAKTLLGNIQDDSISLKISGLNITQQDKTVSYLEKYANSIFFQIDLVLGLPLTVQRIQTQEENILQHNAQTPLNIKYPVCQYDKEALSLYWYARSANEMPLLQYLAYYQVIEFYFSIYSQIKATRTIQNLMKTPGFNIHNDNDVIKVLNIAKSSSARGFITEISQLEATLKECIQISLLKEFLEKNERLKSFLTKKDKMLDLEPLALNENDEILINSIAKRIYDVRCRIVHTKNENDFDNAKSIYPFTKEANLLNCEIELIHYLAKRVLIASSSEFQL